MNAPEMRRVTAEIIAADPNWKAHLLQTARGEYRANLANALIALRRDPEWEGVLAWNDFAVNIQTQRPTPWGKPAGDQWTDNDDRLAANWLQHREVDVSINTAGAAVQTVAMERRFHPVRDYLNSFKWDGKGRLDAWVNTYLGADPEKRITAVFGRMWLISAVARALQPGCKADHCLILEGPQGIGKSTALRTLASDAWFTDQLAELGSKDSHLQCHGVWIIEIAELDSLSRAEVSRTKAFLTAVADKFRLPYGKNKVDWPRDCVFAGSTNRDDYGRDETGARRFWPVPCGRIDLQALTRDRDQIWAEAVVRYREGHQWWLEAPEHIEAAEQEQAERYEGDSWEEKLAVYVLSQSDVSVAELLAHLGKADGHCNRADEMRVSRILKTWGWDRYRARIGDARPWRYRKQ